MIRRTATATALLALLAAHAPAPARAADLSIGSGVFAMSVDPHFYNGIADRALALHLYQRLVEQKGDLSIGPGLASAWQATSDTEWTFTLREDATWSDGRRITAEDVLFSLQRAPNLPNSPLGYGPLMRDVKKVEITSPTSLRITTAQASPNLPVNLAAISILARHAAEGATQSDFNSGKAAIAGGPYRLVRFATNEIIELARNPAWNGPKPAWDKVVFRFIANDGARTAALLAGDVDLIDAPGEADLPRLKTDPRLRVAQTPGNRSIFFLPDIGRETDPPFVTDAQGNKLARNPLRDRRVRQALSIAINRQALTERILNGTAVPMGQFMWPGSYSYAANIKVPAYDPDRARALLAEAGYPAGFRLSLHTYGDRPGFGPTAQAIAQMWTRIGVQTAVEPTPTAMYMGRGARREFSMPVFSWGISTGEVGYALTNLFQPGVSGNWGGYDNPALTALTNQALATLDPSAREKMLVQATEMLTDDIGFIPLYQLVNSWASRKGVIYEPRTDQRSVAMSARPE